jgi:hypothetical protein
LLDEGHPQYIGVSIIFCRNFEPELSLKIRLPFPISGLLPSRGTAYCQRFGELFYAQENSRDEDRTYFLSAIFLPAPTFLLK